MILLSSLEEIWRALVYLWLILIIDADTRRKGARDLARSLLQSFEQTAVPIFYEYLPIFIQVYLFITYFSDMFLIPMEIGRIKMQQLRCLL